MVHIILASSKGKSTPQFAKYLAYRLAGNGVRFFPYTGYLGLTPVKVEGGVYRQQFPSRYNSHLCSGRNCSRRRLEAVADQVYNHFREML